MSEKSVIPDAALAQHTIVLGKTGSGKSSVLRLLVEAQLRKHQPVCIIDPKGDWWGIKSSADGRKKGFPVVIFGGDHADVPINAHAGAQVAELYATGNRPCLIDLGGWMPGDRTRFFIDFAVALFKLTRGPRWLVIDEVHNFVPQGKVLDPDAGKMLHWGNRLITEGRGKGLTVLSASQRPQKVHKDFVTSNETLIAMRVIHELDRNAMKAWIDGCGDPEHGKAVMASLANMPRGQGWVWSPEIGFGPKQITFPMFETYDSFAPQATEADRHPKGWAEVDLEDVKTKLAASVEEAKAKDPRLLAARVRELEQQIAKGAPAQASRTELLEAERRGHQAAAESAADAEARGYRKGYMAATNDARQIVSRHAEAAATELRDAKSRVPADGAPVSNATRPAPAAGIARNSVAPPPLTRAAQPQMRSPTISVGDVRLNRLAERKILQVLAQHSARTVRQLAIQAGYAMGGGGFRGALSKLKALELIASNGDRMEITGAGRDAIGEVDALPTGQALVAHWMSQFNRLAEREVLRVLVEAHPGALAIDEIARRTNPPYEPNGGGFRGAVGKLRTLGLVEGRGELRASEELFG